MRALSDGTHLQAHLALHFPQNKAMVANGMVIVNPKLFPKRQFFFGTGPNSKLLETTNQMLLKL